MEVDETYQKMLEKLREHCEREKCRDMRWQKIQICQLPD